jgi:hypothetical protein
MTPNSKAVPCGPAPPVLRQDEPGANVPPAIQQVVIRHRARLLIILGVPDVCLWLIPCADGRVQEGWCLETVSDERPGMMTLVKMRKVVTYLAPEKRLFIANARTIHGPCYERLN